MGSLKRRAGPEIQSAAQARLGHDAETPYSTSIADLRPNPARIEQGGAFVVTRKVTGSRTVIPATGDLPVQAPPRRS